MRVWVWEWLGFVTDVVVVVGGCRVGCGGKGD